MTGRKNKLYKLYKLHIYDVIGVRCVLLFQKELHQHTPVLASENDAKKKNQIGSKSILK